MNLAALLTGTCISAFALLACAQSASEPSSPAAAQATTGATTPATTQLPPVRVIVKFKQAVPFQSAAFLQSLQVQTGAQVRYVVSSSDTTHVYAFQPSRGQSYAQLMEKLKAIAQVERAELDEKAQAH